MILKKLLKNIENYEIIGDENIDIKEIKTVSNQVSKGSLFVCIKGENVDSHNFIKDIEKYGAIAVVTERYIKTNITQIVVKDSRSALSFIARNFYDCPDEKMKIIGITGTNGKTTTSYLLKSIFDYSKIKCGIIGTLGIYYGDVFVEADLTTPDPIDLFKFLNQMQKDSVKVVVMEVSAHALELRKINGIIYDVGVFTNLTQDHLDYFKNMDRYKKAKSLLFENYKCKYIVSNADDKFGQEIAKKYENVITYGMDNPSDNFALDYREQNGISTFVMNLFDKIYNVKTHLIGLFNVYNILAACSVAFILKIDENNILNGIENCSVIDGRLEKVYDKNFKIYIDYAHTPDGLEKSLITLKKNCSNNLICVFGCGGNRDSLKRPLMGEISGKYATFTVITTDNPRYEEPYEIIREIENGIIKTTKNFVSIEDRTDALTYAINKAEKGDCILIAGKGAEKYQDVLGIKRLYNDKDVINSILKRERLL